MQEFELREAEELVRRALEEDGAFYDLTSALFIPGDWEARGEVVGKEKACLAGLEVAGLVFRFLDPRVEVEFLRRDGETVEAGERVLAVRGRARSILAGERVALNFLQRLSGVATLTRKFVEILSSLPRPPALLDTRKTTPGWRGLERYAVRVGGGTNHRWGLTGGVLLKDNHLFLLRAHGVSLAEAIRRARPHLPPGLRIQVEVSTLPEVAEALRAGAEALLLDNMPPALLREAVRLVGGRVPTEASGGVRLENLREVAETGVDYISTGAITHSARAVDMSLELRGAQGC